MNKKLIVAVVGIGGITLAGKAINNFFSKKHVENVKPMNTDDILESLKDHDHLVISTIDKLLETETETIAESEEGGVIINDARICIKNAEKQVDFMKSHPKEFDDENKIKAIEEAIRDLNGDIHQLIKLRANVLVFDPM